MPFTEQDKEKIDKLNSYISSLPLDAKNGRSFLIQTLHQAQKIFGYLPDYLQEYIAQKLSLPPVDVFGVVSFYSYFTDRKRGKHTISVCLGTACYVKGSQKILEELKRSLNLQESDTTDDGMITVNSVRCIGACGLAPVALVDEKSYGHLTLKKCQQICHQLNGRPDES